MVHTPESIYREYREGVEYKSQLGKRGSFEQNRMNARFYNGDQWYGASVGRDKPLVRHNIIRQIGDYKMGMLTKRPVAVRFFADGVCDTPATRRKTGELKRKLSEGSLKTLQGLDTKEEAGLVCDALEHYFDALSQKLHLRQKTDEVLRQSFITGTGFLYTYWDQPTDLQAGELSCEVLSTDRIFFGDNTADSIEEQPYMLIVTRRPVEQVKSLTARFAGKLQAGRIEPDHPGSSKVTVFTRLYKESTVKGRTVWAISTTKQAVVRPAFDTHLHRYPVTMLRWEKKNERLLGESEITNLIPNQIAINRLITANVWASMSMGMPLMTVNGDTVPGDITNDPGQIIKVYGSNEDVAGAVHYVTPPDFSGDFRENIKDLISQTISGCSAGGLLFKELAYNNTAAIEAMQQSTEIALSPLNNRYLGFFEDTALVWLDFWMTRYTERSLCLEDENGRWYFPFDAARYESLRLCVRAERKGEQNDGKNDY